MPKDLIEPQEDVQELSWRTPELGLDLRRKLFEKVLPQSSPRASQGDAPSRKCRKLPAESRDVGDRPQETGK